MVKHVEAHKVITIKDFQKEVETLHEVHPKLSDEDLFLLWFIKAYLTDDDKLAVGAITNQSEDKNIDAVFIDETPKIAYIIQSKYRKSLGEKPENRSEVVDFAQTAQRLKGDQDQFDEFYRNCPAQLKSLLSEARERVLKRNFRLKMVFVTTGKFPPSALKDAENVARREAAVFEKIDGHDLKLLLVDYLDGIAPAVPELDLEMESGDKIQVQGPLQRFDQRTKIESWVVSMKGDSVAKLFDRAGIRLFARNVRGFLGGTAINAGMEETLRDEPEYFWYFNNGITILCDDAVEVNSSGRKVLRLRNPQVINGQQTTRTLKKMAKEAAFASVLVKVVKVPAKTGAFEKLLSNIVAATNSQNTIKASDLMSNDSHQIELERGLKKLNYYYQRKRQTKGETRAITKNHYRFLLSKFDVAQSVMACEEDPAICKMGESLFAAPYYSIAFPSSDTRYFLVRYWIQKKVSEVAHGTAFYTYAKWHAIGYLWPRVKKNLKGSNAQELFVRNCEKRTPTAEVLQIQKLTDLTFRAIKKFYLKNRKENGEEVPVATFFKKKQLLPKLEKFIASKASGLAGRISKEAKKLDVAFRG